MRPILRPIFHAKYAEASDCAGAQLIHGTHQEEYTSYNSACERVGSLGSAEGSALI
jgi:hypothetical protein